MLQAVRRAHRSALPRHASGAILAALAARQRPFVRPASTSVAAEDLPDAQVDAKKRAYGLVDPVTLFYEHPRMLLDAFKVVVDSGSVRVTGELITQLVANPVVENRQDAIRELFDLPGVEDAADRLLLEPSHADAIAQLSKLPDATRAMSFGLIAKARYEDAPFITAENLISVLPLGNPLSFVRSYLSAMPQHLHRLQLHWERDALTSRGTTADASCAAAVEQLLLVEDYALKHHPTIFEAVLIRSALVRAFAAARAPEHAHRHRSELLQRSKVSTESVDDSFSTARNLEELAAVWAETRPLFDSRRSGAAAQKAGIFPLHYARVGGTGAAHEFFGLEPSAVGDGAHWSTLAREAESRGSQLPDDFVVPEPFKVLRANGLDWDGVAFMLGPFSPVNRLLTPDRMHRSFVRTWASRRPPRRR